MPTAMTHAASCSSSQKSGSALADTPGGDEHMRLSSYVRVRAMPRGKSSRTKAHGREVVLQWPARSMREQACAPSNRQQVALARSVVQVRTGDPFEGAQHVPRPRRPPQKTWQVERLPKEAHGGVGLSYLPAQWAIQLRVRNARRFAAGEAGTGRAAPASDESAQGPRKWWRAPERWDIDRKSRTRAWAPRPCRPPRNRRLERRGRGSRELQDVDDVFPTLGWPTKPTVTQRLAARDESRWSSVPAGGNFADSDVSGTPCVAALVLDSSGVPNSDCRSVA
eukprot:scaffold105851_cov31-Tisochrysis_lutea.AAC.2